MNIHTLDQVRQLVSDWTECHTAVVDTETNGLSISAGDHVISLSIYFPEFDRSYNLPWYHGVGAIRVGTEIRTPEQFHKATWQKKAKKQWYKSYWFQQFREQADFNNVPYEWMELFRLAWNAQVKDKLIIYYNAPFDVHMMERSGYNPPALAEDVRNLVSLVFEDWLYPGLIHPRTGVPIEGSSNQLKWQANFWGVEGALDGETALQQAALEQTNALAEYVVARWDDPINATVHKLKRPARPDELVSKLALDPKSELWTLPSDAVAPYAENDVIITWKLREKLLPKLSTWKLEDLYRLNNAVQLDVAIRMERNGVLLDSNIAQEQRAKLEPIKDEIKAWFDARFDGDFAFSTPKILAVFNTFGIELPDTQKRTLNHWMSENGKHPAIEKLLEYRKAQRASNTYLKNWINSQDEYGYIHPTFNVNGTVTGRWSSSGGVLGKMGNMQNIPSRRFEVKKAVITPAGWRMVQIDYSQIELRLAAWIAGCKAHIDSFNADRDAHIDTMNMLDVRGLLFHQKTDDEIVAEVGLTIKENGTAADAVFTYCRTLAKTCNFALLYRGTYRVLVRMLDIAIEQAQKLHTAWNALYPEYKVANEEFEKRALRRRPRPDGTGATFYVTQPLGGRARRYEMYPTFEVVRDKKTGEVIFTQNTRQRKAKDAFNAVVQGQATYIITASSLEICHKYGDDIFRPWALIHDSINAYIRGDHLHILPDIVATMTDWPTDPKMAAAVDLSSTGSWHDLKEVEDLDELIAVRDNIEEDDDEQTDD